MKEILLTIILLLSVLRIIGQEVKVTYIDPQLGDESTYKFLRIGNSSDYYGGIMWNNNHDYYGNGNDFSIFTYSNRDLTFRTGTGNAIFFPSSGGKVGIGTTSPSEKLDVIGNIKMPGNNYYLKAGTWNYFGTAASSYGYYGMCLRYKNDQWESFHSSINGMAMKFIPNGIDFITASPNQTPATISTLMRIKADGSVTIDGKITSKEVEVKTDVWADFVFYPNYKLKTLEEVEQYIKANKHLPDVPSEKEVKENGLSLGQSDAVLLQKIEELTLYLIEQNKEVKSGKLKVEKLNTEKVEVEVKVEKLTELLKAQEAAIEELKKEIKELKK